MLTCFLNAIIDTTFDRPTYTGPPHLQVSLRPDFSTISRSESMSLRCHGTVTDPNTLSSSGFLMVQV